MYNTMTPKNLINETECVFYSSNHSARGVQWYNSWVQQDLFNSFWNWELNEDASNLILLRISQKRIYKSSNFEVIYKSSNFFPFFKMKTYDISKKNTDHKWIITDDCSQEFWKSYSKVRIIISNIPLTNQIFVVYMKKTIELGHWSTKKILNSFKVMFGPAHFTVLIRPIFKPNLCFAFTIKA